MLLSSVGAALVLSDALSPAFDLDVSSTLVQIEILDVLSNERLKAVLEVAVIVLVMGIPLYVSRLVIVNLAVSCANAPFFSPCLSLVAPLLLNAHTVYCLVASE